MKYLGPIFYVTLLTSCSGATPPKITNGGKDDGSTRTEIVKLQGEIKTRNTDLAKFRNTEDKLTKYLTVDANRGCFLQQPLKSIEILVNGNLPGPRMIGLGNPMTDDGDSTKFAFSLGSDITINADLGIMKANGTLSSTEFAAKKVADISQLQVTKMGAKFFNDRKCTQSCSVFVFCRTTCQTAISELNSAVMTSLEIKINGKSFYKNANLGKAFTFGDRVLSIKDYKNRAEYLDLLAVQDCAEK